MSEDEGELADTLIWFCKGITMKKGMCLCDKLIAQYTFLCWIYASSVLTALKLGIRHCVLWIWMLLNMLK